MLEQLPHPLLQQHPVDPLLRGVFALDEGAVEAGPAVVEAGDALPGHVRVAVVHPRHVSRQLLHHAHVVRRQASPAAVTVDADSVNGDEEEKEDKEECRHGEGREVGELEHVGREEKGNVSENENRLMTGTDSDVKILSLSSIHEYKMKGR